MQAMPQLREQLGMSAVRFRYRRISAPIQVCLSYGYQNCSYRKGIPIDKSQELIRPERIRIEKELLKLELRFGGRAFAYVGKCLYCPDSECARKCNRPCLHPDKVRPSLEAFGFDIAHTLSELFGIELLWGKNDILPEYLVLVSGLFHNSTENIISHTKRNQDLGNL